VSGSYDLALQIYIELGPDVLEGQHFVINVCIAITNVGVNRDILSHFSEN
jgi:hypothetical protein